MKVDMPLIKERNTETDFLTDLLDSLFRITFSKAKFMIQFIIITIIKSC